MREKKLKFLLKYKFSGWKTYIKEEMKQEKAKKAERNEIKEEATIWERVFSEANESKRNNRTTTTNEIKAAYISLKKSVFFILFWL